MGLGAGSAANDTSSPFPSMAAELPRTPNNAHIKVLWKYHSPRGAKHVPLTQQRGCRAGGVMAVPASLPGRGRTQRAQAVSVPQCPLPAAHSSWVHRAARSSSTATASSKPNQPVAIPWERKLLTPLESARRCELCICMSLLSPCEMQGPVLLCYL